MGKKMICIDCVRPDTLRKLIFDNGEMNNCQYCGKRGVAAELKFLFDYILDRAVENTATEDDLSQYEDWMAYEGGSDDIPIACLDVVLAEWLDLGDEPYFDDLYRYAPNEIKLNAKGFDRHYFDDHGQLERNCYEDKWENFITDIRHSHRFFNPNAKGFLDSIFAFLSCDADELKPECLRVIRRGELLYRARSAATYEDIKKIIADPASQLGPPPKDRSSSQRMTPNGISALYCALDRDTCLSEIRSIMGDNVVSVAMTPVTQLTLLDLTNLDRVEPPKLTFLDKGYLDALHLKNFVSSLVKKMSKPKGRSDDLNYLSTQVVFEYLRLRFSSQVNGLVFPSVQTGETGTNVVLFPEFSIVSTRSYQKQNDYEIAMRAFESETEEPFEEGAYLYCQAGSLVFHKVKAIRTEAYDYARIEELFMSDLERKRSRFF